MVRVEFFAKRQLKKVNPDERRCMSCVEALLKEKQKEKLRIREASLKKKRQREEKKKKKYFSNKKVVDKVSDEDINTCVQVLRFIAQDPETRWMEKRMKTLRAALMPIIDFQKKRMYSGVSEDEYERT